MASYLGHLVFVLCKNSLEFLQVNFSVGLGIEAMEDAFEVLRLALAGVPFLYTHAHAREWNRRRRPSFGMRTWDPIDVATYILECDVQQ